MMANGWRIKMSQDDSRAGKAFSFSMTLEDPTKVAGLRALISLHREHIYSGLSTIKTLHYARFLPLEALGQILFVAEYDGPATAFIDELGRALKEPLNLLLAQMKNGPPLLPIEDHQQGFKDYVKAAQGFDTSPFSAYEGRTVQQILDTEPPPGGGKAAPPARPAGDETTAARIAGPFNLLMRLEDPRKLPELLARLADPYTKGRIDRALKSLDYVHYARFLPLIDRGALMIITEFDGIMRDYVMDFAAALDREFSLILSYMKDRPKLPVSEYPTEFWDYVSRNLVEDTGLYAAYPGKTVLDIVGAGKPKELPEQPKGPATTFDLNEVLNDVQANVLKGFRPSKAFHYYLQFPTAELGRKFVQEFPVTAAGQEKPSDESVCFNIGFTHAGLAQLGVPSPILGAFPEAFRAGPAARAEYTGDAGDDGLGDWVVGGPQSPDVHAVVSVLCRKGAKEAPERQRIETLIDKHGVRPQACSGGNKYAIKAEAFADASDLIHFGYRDGISQPRIEGVSDLAGSGQKANAVPGDFLLGHDYVNSRGGRYIGKLFEPLVKNGTYAAYRIIEQKVADFERWLDKHARECGLTTEQLAAKLMGRFRDGTPIAKYDQAADTPVDDFDYASQETGSTTGDPEGLRCPIGAHIRRFNPRSGLVLGLPWGRHLLRRGLPFGSRYDPDQGDDDIKRGLVGMFMCGDLEGQFEFLLNVWGRKDLSAYGLRNTQDAFTAHAPTRFHLLDGNKVYRELTVDRLTQTLGSLYLFMPGIEGLKWIGSGNWLEGESGELATRFGKLAMPAPSQELNPTLPAFRNDPYRFYATRRMKSPVEKVRFKQDSYWVFSHELVTEVCDPKNQHVYLKPGKNRLKSPRPFGIAGETDDGLFFMDPPRHSDVRPAMDEVFTAAIEPILKKVDDRADSLVKMLAGLPRLEVVTGYAGQIAPWAFMEVMGIPPGPEGPPANMERLMVESWTRAMLNGRDPNLAPDVRVVGGTAGLALRAYLSALAREQIGAGKGCPMASNHIMSGLQKLSCSGLTPRLNSDEVVNTASHFALGGYLSTEFLIITGVCNLLRNPEQWELLHAEPGLLDKAIWEMLRYDAPFQMADRWVEKETDLGGVKIEAGSKVTVVYGSANRDENVFVNPDRFNIERDYDVSKIYGFGHGIHRCIGERLALAIARAAIGALVRQFPKARLSNKDQGEWLPDPYFRSLTKLTIDLN